MGRPFVPICAECGEYIYSARAGKKSKRCRKCQLALIDEANSFFHRYKYKNKNRVKI